MRRLLYLLSSLLLAIPSFAATHYVCAATGSPCNASDSNAGTSKTATWQHAPGMPNCASSCASYSPVAGDSIIFRGGDTWHYGNSGLSPYTGGEWHADNWAGGTCKYEGVTTGCIYWGVDLTWYSGSSWARPIMTGDNPTSTSLVSSCAYQVASNNNLMVIYNGAWLDNIEFTGFCSSRNPGSSGPSTDILVGYGGTGDVIETNLYIHGWTATTTAGSSNNTIPCTLFGGSTQSTATQSVSALVIDGSDSNPGSCAWGTFPMFSHFKDSIIRYTTQGIGQGCHDVHDNIFEYIYNPNLPTHGNILECNAEASGSTPNVFYNNIMRHINSNFFSSGQVGWWFCPNTTEDFWFNNLAYDTGGYNDGDWWAIAGTTQYPSCTNTGTQRMFNNTFSGTLQPCHLSGSNPTGGIYLYVYNEHLMNSPYDASGCNGGPGDASNITQTWTQSDSQGYTTGSAGVTDSDTCANDSTKPCSPTAGTNATVAAGRNEQAFCTTLASYSSEQAIGTDAANACKYSTTDGCTYNTSTHSMSCPAEVAVVRPASANFDVGAYQYPGVTVALPVFTPPTGTQFANGQIVTITSSTSGATLCYTLDGSTPTATTPGTCSHGTTLTNGGTVNVSATETVNVLGTLSGDTNSSVASASFTVGGGVTSNIDDIPPTSSGSPAIGWATPPYVDTGCGDPTGPTSYPHTIGNTSPSLDGFSSLFTLVSAPEGCVGWFYNSGPQDLGTVITNDFQYYSGSTNSSGTPTSSTFTSTLKRLPIQVAWPTILIFISGHSA